MRRLKTFDCHINEDFNAMLGIENFLSNPIMLTLATAWLIKGNYKIENLSSNISEMKNDFLDYCVIMGYAIDKNMLDYKFKEMIDKIKNILKL